MQVMRFPIIVLLGLLLACSGPQQQPATTKQDEVKEVTPGETGILIEYLASAGDYVNSRKFPSMIKASTVYKELGGNILVIDMRKPDYYQKGHI